jgi:hypothetical protein
MSLPSVSSLLHRQQRCRKELAAAAGEACLGLLGLWTRRVALLMICADGFFPRRLLWWVVSSDSAGRVVCVQPQMC